MGFPAYENLGIQIIRLVGRDLVEGHTGEATCAAMLRLEALQKHIVDTGVSRACEGPDPQGTYLGILCTYQ